ncbi:hypothetical protein [Prochlorococcus sp. MIT 1307]|uniref:tetratricopeptide repeat protein n=1 Tax=Prochlorococcus sp. MIT 1307 TaxID=3096219 RepID=UPI002A758451|nr:hypothetical protein [Prochlorococcus sp. MIT 1307]
MNLVRASLLTLAVMIASPKVYAELIKDPKIDPIAKAATKIGNEDYYGAIYEANKALEIYKEKPNRALAYYIRGLSKKSLNDCNQAISDFDKSIELDPKRALYYFYRGQCKGELEQFYDVISDMNQAIKLNRLSSVGIGKQDLVGIYFQRAVARFMTGDRKGSINDYTFIIDFNNDFPNTRGDTTNKGDAYYGRGYNKKFLNDIVGACYDFRKALSLGHMHANEQLKESCK